MGLMNVGAHFPSAETFPQIRITAEITDFLHRLKSFALLPFSCRGEKEVVSPNLQQQRNDSLLVIPKPLT